MSKRYAKGKKQQEDNDKIAIFGLSLHISFCFHLNLLWTAVNGSNLERRKGFLVKQTLSKGFLVYSERSSFQGEQLSVKNYEEDSSSYLLNVLL